MSTVSLSFEEPVTSLHEYVQVPSIFTISSILEVREFQGGFALEKGLFLHSMKRTTVPSMIL